jgi:hypothetical protein
MTDHPIVPSPELIQEWENKYEGHMPEWIIRHVAYEAAKWGADQELEACIHWLITGPYGASIACNADHMIGDLRAARRPKPPSLKEQALTALTRYTTGETILTNGSVDIIRRALEQLDD